MSYFFRPRLLPSLAALMTFLILLSLGYWQLTRAEQKKQLENELAQRSQIVINLHTLNANKSDLRFYQIQLTGHFDNAHSVLLDNKFEHHQVGYHLFTPFIITNSAQVILVNRGWIAQGKDRQQLPAIEVIAGTQTIAGLLNHLPGKGLTLGHQELFTGRWPWRVPVIDEAVMQTLQQQVGKPFYPYVLLQAGKAQPFINSSAQKHIAYAVQWFALALVVLILFVVLSVKKHAR